MSKRYHYGRFKYVFLYITENCQLRCKHCYMGNRLNEKREMEVETIRNILKTCKRMGTTHVTILGGEPTLHRKFSEIVQMASDLQFESVCVDTNGLCINELKKLKPSMFQEIRISLDGAGSKANDYIRGKGVFEQVIKNAEELIALGYYVVFTCTVQKKNIGETIDLINLAEKMNVRKVNFHVMSTEGNGKEINDLALNANEWCEVCKKIEQYKSNVEVWYPPVWISKEKLQNFVNKGYKGCLGYATDRLSIMPDGRAYICSMLFDYPFHFFKFDKSGNLSINKERNEMDLFYENVTCDKELIESGCSAEKILGEEKDGFISICRCWKRQISNE